MNRLLRLFLCGLVFIGQAAPPATWGCAIAPQPGQRIGVNKEEALIIYDAETDTEHFIRRAQFAGEADSFGFMVPTPTQPELADASFEIFSTLAGWTAPRREWSGKTVDVIRKRSRFKSSSVLVGAAPGAPAGPTIVERKQVAGYDAVVLRASDLEGLKEWLAKNEYDTREPLMQWLAWYVEHEWYITAFKLASAAQGGGPNWNVSVRISFQTEKPFYPYREPADMRTVGAIHSPRELRVFFLSNARYEGALGEGGRWNARTAWANTVANGPAGTIFSNLGLTTEATSALGAKKWHLTEFEDNSSPRPGTDEIYFRVAESQAAVERPVIYYDNQNIVYVDEPALPFSLTAWLWLSLGGAVVITTVVGGLVFLVRRKPKPARGTQAI